MNLTTVKLKVPSDCNIILGQTHFIKSVEDLYEIFIGAVPGIKFGIAFSEASGPCLIRREGNDEELMGAAVASLQEIASGHTFLAIMRNAYPINVLNAIKMCQEVCSIFCATANPVEIILAQSEQGNGILGVIDGFAPKGVETTDDVKQRKELLRKFQYKL